MGSERDCLNDPSGPTGTDDVVKLLPVIIDRPPPPEDICWFAFLLLKRPFQGRADGIGGASDEDHSYVPQELFHFVHGAEGSVS